MKQRGLVKPLLVIPDGNSGLRKADLEQAQGIVAMYEQEYREAMKYLRTDLEAVLTALRFPESHRKRIRTTNLLLESGALLSTCEASNRVLQRPM